VSRKTAPLLLATSELLRQFGERLRLARLRRRFTAKHVAERAGMNPMTLRSLERGGSGVTIGAYLAVMQVLGFERELDHLAQADALGRSLQDARLVKTAGTTLAGSYEDIERDAMAIRQPRVPRSSSEPPKNWIDEGGYVSSRKLAALLDAPVAHSSRPKTKSETKPNTKARSMKQTGTPTKRASSSARKR
jgi:transcriptional regulator with XRE-family HTH domain